MVRSWRYVHDDVYDDLSLAVCRLTLHPWQLAPVVQNTVLTDRSRNHPGVRSVIEIRNLSRGYSLLGVDRFLAFTRIALSQLFGGDRSLAVARIDLSRSLGSISRGHSTRSLAVTRHG
ncbi:hypothetical protein F2Q70_00035556 [Brassica cretica]|uniref:Uncharacterized protein n=1 Tax=Brassica cretica TaxID=69181 RepID=A0A8S9JZR9_BRACR|nr:hypothetical protein F2Q70_00035556 [Brassica cretica]